jgi:hypothetical protein
VAQVVQDDAGHRGAAWTRAGLVLQRYGHLYPGASERAAKALDAYLFDVAVAQAWGVKRPTVKARARIPWK